MKTVVFIIFCLVAVHSFSQPCLPQGITFTTQSQIDSFHMNYPNCREIIGDVIIMGGTSITNLLGLTGLKSVGGELQISSSNVLTNLTGLDSLTSSNALKIYNNAGLTSLTGLDHLDSVGEFFTISQNPLLTSFTGLEKLSVISGNCVLGGFVSGMAGLNNLRAVGGFFHIVSLPNLVTLAGLERLKSIGTEFTLSFCPVLNDMTGLDSLLSITGNLTIMNNGLTSLNGLESLTTVGWYIGIESNSALSDITGIENINAGAIGGGIAFRSNPNLSSCAILSVCDYLAIPGGNVFILDNSPGCNSPQEVMEACGILSVREVGMQPDLVIYPTVVTSRITIETRPGNIGSRFQILDMAGRTILDGQILQTPYSLDISGLQGGIYMIRIGDSGSRAPVKVIIIN